MRLCKTVFSLIQKELGANNHTEQSLARYIRLQGYRLGADEVSFEPIVASGPNAAVPHHSPGTRKLRAGETIILDFGFKVGGYCSDFTRTIFLRRASAGLADVYRAVEAAYRRAFLAAQPGLLASALHGEASDELSTRGYGRFFIHNLGHGCGLEIHEPPWISPGGTATLSDGMVFSIEPGAYLPGRGGVRIEDLVYLTQKGARKFISVPTDLKSNII
jgi:Xaa-Pro dipeptidase